MFNRTSHKLNTKSIKNDNKENPLEVTKKQNEAAKILKALGGKENIIELDACITRLRVRIKNMNKVDKDSIIVLGAKGVLEKGNNIQAIFGLKSYQFKKQIKEIMYTNRDTEVKGFKEKAQKTICDCSFVSPLSGKLLPLENVPDEVFSNKMMGDGFAIYPIDGEIVSPVNGEIETLFPTKHGIGIKANNGRKILIHFGVDTVDLNGEGFDVFVNEGDCVNIGQPIIRVDLNKVKSLVPSIITSVIFTNLEKDEVVSFKLGLDVKSGQGQIITIE